MRRIQLVAVVLVLWAALPACRKTETAAVPGAAVAAEAPAGTAAGVAAQAQAEAPAAAPAAAPATPPKRPDPGPQLAMKSGTATTQAAAPIEVKATARLVEGDHVYVVAALPGGAEVPEVYAPRDTADRVRVDVRGARHGAAAVQDDLGAGTRTLYVRLVGAEVPERVTLALYGAPTSDYDARRRPRGWRSGQLTITDVAAAPVGKDLRATFFAAFADHLQRWGSGEGSRPRPFYAFATSRAGLLAAKATRAPAEATAALARERRSDLDEMMSLYTGALSVEEALQADRGLLLRAEAGRERTVPVDTLEGVPLAAHPWPELQAALGREPVTEPLAAVVPPDVLYLHFSDLRTAVRLMDDLDDWVSPAAQLMDARPGTNHLVARYQEQLVVERIGLAKRIGHLAADGVAFVADDPFLREGSQVALLFHVKERALLTSALAYYEAQARERHPDVAESRWQAGKYDVRVLSTPDGTVQQHRAELGAVLVLTNGRRMMERIVAATDGAAPTLAQSGDFRYLRTLYPHTPAGADPEAGFLFLSDAFVAHAVSPRVKIGAARRVAAAADLMAVADAALLFGWLEGRQPKDAAELVASGILTEAELAHADGAPIRLDPQGGPWSEAWGRPAALRPLAEVPLDKVTPAEREAYDRFRNTYQSYWRTYIDPVAVRLGRSEDGRRLVVDGRMLPLIEGSDYDDIIEKVGRARVQPPALTDAVQWTFAVGTDANLRRELDTLPKMVGQSGITFGWLGDWVMVGAASRSSLWDLALFSGQVPESEQRKEGFDDEETAIAVIARLPVYVGAHVRNPLSLAATLTALRAAAFSAAPGMLEWGEVGTYRDVPIVAIRARPGATPGPRGLERIGLHYAVAKDVFVASLDRDVLELQIDAALDGRTAQPTPAGDAKAAENGTQADLRLALDDAASWLGRALLGMFEGEARRALDDARLDVEALARGRGGLPADPAAFRAEAMAWLGYEPRAVQGGAFTLTPEGLVAHERYGSPIAPTFPEVPLPDTPLTKVVTSLRALAMNIAFEGEGNARGLRVRAEWVRR